MPDNPDSELSATQQSMLDLALACDLKVSETKQHAAIRTRHSAITSQKDAADYIREVENKVHSRRKFGVFKAAEKNFKSAVAPATASATPRANARTLTGKQASGAIGFLLAAMVLAGWFLPAGANLVLVTLSLLLMMAVLGMATTNRPLGILINERNLMSLSRFQMVVWTVLILGAYLTFALARIKAMAAGLPGENPIADALAVQIDWHLWALLGISTTSLVGAPLILSSKKDQEPTQSATQKTAQMVNEPEADIVTNKQGTLYANTKMSDARLTDMFEGDELIDTARIDLAKVQMFYFTIIAAICFFVMVFNLLLQGQAALAAGKPYLEHLPLLPDGFVAVLGISHAGYLTSKSISRTQSQS
jgi:hypothetical protein